MRQVEFLPILVVPDSVQLVHLLHRGQTSFKHPGQNISPFVTVSWMLTFIDNNTPLPHRRTTKIPTNDIRSEFSPQQLVLQSVWFAILTDMDGYDDVGARMKSTG